MPAWTYPATVHRVIDGDSLRCTIDLGFRLSYTATIRLAEIDTPELSTVAGKTARAYAEELLPPGTPITITSKTLDKYGRVLGTITLPDGRDYATTIRDAGHAQPYPRAGTE